MPPECQLFVVMINMNSVLLSFQEKLDIGVFRHLLVFFLVLKMNLVFENQAIFTGNNGPRVFDKAPTSVLGYIIPVKRVEKQWGARASATVKGGLDSGQMEKKMASLHLSFLSCGFLSFPVYSLPCPVPQIPCKHTGPDILCAGSGQSRVLDCQK